MPLTEYPKWIRSPGKPDVLVQTADEEADQLARWSVEDGSRAVEVPPANRLVDAAPVVPTPVADPVPSVERVRPPEEPRAQQLAVVIPDDWRDLPYIPRKSGDPCLKSLASSVSSDPITSKDKAIAAIEAEIAKRA